MTGHNSLLFEVQRTNLSLWLFEKTVDYSFVDFNEQVKNV